MSKRIKKTKRTSNNNTTAHTVSYTQPTERQYTRSSAGASQRNSASKLSPKKIGKNVQSAMIHPTTQHKRDYQAAKVKVQAKLNTRAGSQKVSSRSSVRKIVPQVASQKSSAAITPNKRQQVTPNKKQSSILKKSKAITKKKTTKSRSVKKSKSSSSASQSIKVNLFGTKKVTLRSSPVKKVKRSSSTSSKKKSIQKRSKSTTSTEQSRISIRDNKMSIRKANEASPDKASRSSSVPGGSGNINRRRVQPIRKNKAPYSGDRQAKVKAARTMHQMYLNMGLKNKSSAIKLVKDKKLHA